MLKYLFIIAALVYVMSGCNSAKRTARKNYQAQEQLRAHPAAAAELCTDLFPRVPGIPDSTAYYIAQAQIDSLYAQGVATVEAIGAQRDSLGRIADSLGGLVPFGCEASIAALNRVVAAGRVREGKLELLVAKLKAQPAAVLTRTVPDLATEKLLRDEVAGLRKQNNDLVQANLVGREKHTGGGLWLPWYVFVIIGVLVTGGFILKLKKII